MQDVFNPTNQEIREWAYSNGSYPEEDWDIVVFHDVTDDGLTALILDIATDKNCPKQKTFVHFLDIITGAVVRYAAEKGYNEEELKKLNTLIADAEKKSSPLVIDWANRTKQIIQFPERFRYKDWFLEKTTAAL